MHSILSSVCYATGRRLPANPNHRTQTVSLPARYQVEHYPSPAEKWADGIVHGVGIVAAISGGSVLLTLSIVNGGGATNTATYTSRYYPGQIVFDTEGGVEEIATTGSLGNVMPVSAAWSR